ncbi:MAG TPA: VCBS repeat-containing protein, partial [Bryobacteraceae bacterium]|nr:VCBS repeat-containing protein [Bryobacteraceae bacterium]
MRRNGRVQAPAMSHHLKLVVGSITAVICLAAFQSPAARFETIEKSGINSSLNPAKTPEKHLIETMAGGVALIDADGDGLLDVFLANGAPQPKLHKTGPTWSNRLYRNKGNLEFEDVTDKSGLHGLGFDIGTAAADYDNDGDTDLFVTGVRGNTLFRNEGALKFADVTRQAKLGQDDVPAHQRWSVGAGWFDFDRDGWLDLFVVRYVQWLPEREPFCGDQQKGYRSYCHPKHYEGLPNALYRNNRDGTFTDMSSASGVAAHVGKGMGVAFADMDADLDIDVLVTNDTVPNFLFRNEGNGKFSQVGMQSGIALNDDGRALSSMGADFRDINNDGQEDIFITALSNETFPLYQNSAKGFFLDVTYPSRLGTLTLPWSGWGTGIFDFNNDGWK